jgi:hypothetical protein
MNLRALAVAGIICAGLLMNVTAAHAVPSHDDSFSKQDLFKADVNKLKDTQLIAHPDLPLSPTTNVLWCGTLQLAWNEAIALVGEKLTVVPPSPVADLLNQQDFNRTDLAPGSYVALADFERNHVEDEIRAALEKTFHGAASPELIPPIPPHPGPDDFVAYAYLYKNLAFAQPFADDFCTFGDREVKCFGFKEENHLPSGTVGQVSIDDYQSPDDFVIELKTLSPDDELILAKVSPGPTLQATIQGVLARLAHATPQTAGSGDSMEVPKLNFDLRRDFQELEGHVIVPTPAAKIKNKLILSKVEQLVRFQLNEKGAILKSEAVAVANAMAMRASHQLIFDRPFLILMKQKTSAQPYFALWVGNTTLLAPASN